MRAVDDITLQVNRNEIYGLAGESSSGKTSFIKTIAAANRPPLNVVGGSVRFSFLDRDIHSLGEDELAAMRWKHLSYIMQGSMNVLNPVRRIKRSFFDFAFAHIGEADAASSSTSSRATCGGSHLEPSVLDAYPHELSGGMRQRVTIALATICRPEFIIADEPTTALDVVVQKGVLGMIREVQREMGSSIAVRHARHGGARQHGGPARHHVRGPPGRGGADPRALREAASPLHRAPDREPAADRRRRAEEGPRRHAAEPFGAAAGLPLPSALPARDGHLPPRGSRADDACAGPPRRVLRGEPCGAAGGARRTGGGG